MRVMGMGKSETFGSEREMKTRILGIVLCASLLAGCGLLGLDERGQAIELYKEGKTDEAIPRLRVVLDKKGDWVWCRYNAGPMRCRAEGVEWVHLGLSPLRYRNVEHIPCSCEHAGFELELVT